MAETPGVNREYRDRLFKFVFGNPKHKEWTLDLYNAVNNTNYTDANEIQLNTIEDVVYMHMKNDISFLFQFIFNFYEHQSTFNPNMPMRFLIYLGMAYSKYIEGNTSYHKFSSSLQKAPAPKCVCFYNGNTKKDDKIILKLSDAFDSESDVELKVTMININYGHNKELLDACIPLKEYSYFIDKIRINRQTMKTLEEAVDAALEELSDESIIKPFLLENKAEVKHMCITEYDEDRAFAEQREEGIEEGILRGKKEGIEEGIEIGIVKGRAEGIEEGMEKGIEKGKAEAFKEALANMIKSGMNEDQAKKILGLA